MNRTIMLQNGSSAFVHDGAMRLVALLQINGYAVVNAEGRKIVVAQDENGNLFEPKDPLDVVPEKDQYDFIKHSGIDCTDSKTMKKLKQQHHLDQILSKKNKQARYRK